MYPISKDPNREHIPIPGSQEELNIFNELQDAFRMQFELIFPDRLARKTILILPSLTLNQEILTKLKGHIYYEERLLCLLMLLRMPETEIIYVTSMPVDPVIVDYYIHLIPGITGFHARQRLHLLSCYDASHRSLTEKILARPRMINRIRSLIDDPSSSHITCFNVTPIERTLAVRLGIPVYGFNPDLLDYGSKSGSRSLFKKNGIAVPPGFEYLKSEQDICHSLAQLKMKYPDLQKAVLKLEEGFSGDGNAVFTYPVLAKNEELTEIRIRQSFTYHLKVIAENTSIPQYLDQFSRMGGIVEAFIAGNIKNSPSVQCRINPLGQSEIISTHDQLLGGEDAQVFLGAEFPANPAYCHELAETGLVVANALCKEGGIGRFSVDFVSVLEEQRWKHYAIEINLRKGGTTHPFLLLQLLTDGNYDSRKGTYKTASGNERFYLVSDNVVSQAFRGLTPPDLMDILMHHDLLYDSSRQEGILFHLMGALSQYGKTGILCIADSKEKARVYFEKILRILEIECQ